MFFRQLFPFLIFLGFFHAPAAPALSCRAAGPDFENIITVKIRRKTVYGLFTPHLTNQAEIILSLIKGSEEQTRQNFREFLQAERPFAAEQKEDVFAIVRLLSRRPQIQWIGIEASSKEMEEEGFAVAKTAKDYQGMKQLFQAAIGMSAEETDSLLHLMYPAEFIALAENPHLFQNIRFVPIDDSYYKEESGLLREKIDSLRDQIIDRSRAIGLPYADFEKIEAIQWGALKEYKTIGEDRRAAALSLLHDMDLKALVDEYFSSMNMFLGHSFERDKTMAALTAAALERLGDGLILAGSHHRYGVIEGLLSACLPAGRP